MFASHSVPFLKTQAWRKLRLKALQRDHFRCVKCGESVSRPGQSRVDHLLSRKTHPHMALVLANLRTLCARCDNQAHREKGRLDRSSPREERFSGFTADGTPLDPQHHWNRR
jgi:5-methylcytosine-specific restriction endonuclease McrA